MCPFKMGLCGIEVGGVGAIGDEVEIGAIGDNDFGAGAGSCGRDFPCPLDDTSPSSSYASQRRVFGCSAA